MEYKQIYRETKVNPPDPGERADRFFTLTLYEALGDYQAPLLLKVESGNPQLSTLGPTPTYIRLYWTK